MCVNYARVRRTDIRLYAIDALTGAPMNATTLTALLWRIFADVQRQINAGTGGGLPLAGITQASTETTSRLSTSEIVLIAIAALVIIGGE